MASSSPARSRSLPPPLPDQQQSSQPSSPLPYKSHQVRDLSLPPLLQPTSSSSTSPMLGRNALAALESGERKKIGAEEEGSEGEKEDVVKEPTAERVAETDVISSESTLSAAPSQSRNPSTSRSDDTPSSNDIATPTAIPTSLQSQTQEEVKDTDMPKINAEAEAASPGIIMESQGGMIEQGTGSAGEEAPNRLEAETDGGRSNDKDDTVEPKLKDEKDHGGRDQGEKDQKMEEQSTTVIISDPPHPSPTPSASPKVLHLKNDAIISPAAASTFAGDGALPSAVEDVRGASVEDQAAREESGNTGDLPAEASVALKRVVDGQAEGSYRSDETSGARIPTSSKTQYTSAEKSSHSSGTSPLTGKRVDVPFGEGETLGHAQQKPAGMDPDFDMHLELDSAIHNDTLMDIGYSSGGKGDVGVNDDSFGQQNSLHHPVHQDGRVEESDGEKTQNVADGFGEKKEVDEEPDEEGVIDDQKAVVEEDVAMAEGDPENEDFHIDSERRGIPLEPNTPTAKPVEEMDVDQDNLSAQFDAPSSNERPDKENSSSQGGGSENGILERVRTPTTNIDGSEEKDVDGDKQQTCQRTVGSAIGSDTQGQQTLVAATGEQATQTRVQAGSASPLGAGSMIANTMDVDDVPGELPLAADPAEESQAPGMDATLEQEEQDNGEEVSAMQAETENVQKIESWSIGNQMISARNTEEMSRLDRAQQCGDDNKVDDAIMDSASGEPQGPVTSASESAVGPASGAQAHTTDEAAASAPSPSIYASPQGDTHPALLAADEEAEDTSVATMRGASEMLEDSTMSDTTRIHPSKFSIPIKAVTAEADGDDMLFEEAQAALTAIKRQTNDADAMDVDESEPPHTSKEQDSEQGQEQEVYDETSSRLDPNHMKTPKRKSVSTGMAIPKSAGTSQTSMADSMLETPTPAGLASRKRKRSSELDAAAILKKKFKPPMMKTNKLNVYLGLEKQAPFIPDTEMLPDLDPPSSSSMPSSSPLPTPARHESAYERRYASKRLAKPFKAPIDAPSSDDALSDGSPSKSATAIRQELVELENRKQLLTQAVKISKQPDEGVRLRQLVQQWLEAGRTISEKLFESMEAPTEQDLNGFGEEVPSLSSSTATGKNVEAMATRSWNVGNMLKTLSVDPELFAWNAEIEDWKI